MIEVYYIFALVVLLPLFICFQKTGKPPALAFLVLVPLFGFLIAVTVLAFGRWPFVPGQGGSTG